MLCHPVQHAQVSFHLFKAIDRCLDMFLTGKSQELVEQIAARNPFGLCFDCRRCVYPGGRIGEVNDIVPAVLFLASPQAAWITSQTICVNGGSA